jgi:ribosomal protein S6
LSIYHAHAVIARTEQEIPIARCTVDWMTSGGERSMPYKIKKFGKGYKTVSPNHPQGFSKAPQSKKQAIKQMVAIKMHDKENK